MSPRPSSSKIPPTHISLYPSHHSRSKSHLPPPKVLPFPDLPVRSRPTSPAGSPGPSRSAREWDHEAATLGVVTDSDGERGFGSSMSPPLPSPMASGSGNPRLVLSLSPSSRTRSHTEPTAMSRSNSGILTPSPSPTPARTEVLHPTPLSAPIHISPATQPVPLPTVSPASPSLSTRSSNRLPPKKKVSNSPSTPPVTAPLTPASPTEPLNYHLYRSFLKGSCADVRLWVRKWGMGWCVHRVVVIQAGFFHSLFLGGFSETTVGARRTSSAKGKEKAQVQFDGDEWDGEEVELKFDDPNITRAAFEICLSRLYSPFPHLHYSMHLLSTPSHPFSPSYPPSSSSSSSLHSTHLSLPANTHLATPRLLLSLLANTIYLGQSSLMREVLALILRTVGPWTVMRYLDFAIGHGLGEEEWDGQTEAGARGLEELGRTMRVRRESEISDPEDMKGGDENGKVGGPDLARAVSHSSTFTLRGTPRLGMTITSQHEDSTTPDDPELLPHFYGFASNEIGEACICYLSRWGMDLLVHELANPGSPPIFGHRGLPARFVAALLGTDLFWVKDEMERYRAARKILDLRRRGWQEEMDGRGDLSGGVDEEDRDWEEDEVEMGKVFAEGIHYTHIPFEYLLLIGNDIDPTTSLPYAPSSVLQAALWTAEELRSRILSQGDLSTSAEDSIDLGLTQSSSDIIATSSRHRRGTPRSRVASPTSGSFPPELSVSSSLSPFPIPPCKVYYPIPTDDTQGLGAGGLLSKLTQLQDMPNIPDLGPDNTASLPDAASASRSRPPPHSETTAFGLLTGARSLLDLSDNLGESRWSKIPPFRFSVEFWNLDKLLEKERAYSDTHFYAGSWFNVYVQLIRKKDKGTQLGIYLHRQSPAEPFPIPSTPWRKVEKVGSTPPMGLTRAISSPVVGVGSPPISARSEESPAGKEEEGPYRDPRRITKAYFSISCASALGTAVIRFISAPDNFTISQSWGWKSSALRSEEYLGGGGGSGSGSSGAESLEDGVLGWVGDVGEGRGREGREGREGSLRATVVVGVI